MSINSQARALSISFLDLSLATSRRHLSQLSIDRLKAPQYLSQLSLAHLEHHLLVLCISTLGLVFLQVHLDVQGWLLDSVFSL